MTTVTKQKPTWARTWLIGAIIVISSALIISIVVDALTSATASAVTNPHNLWYPTGFGANFWNSLSTFTIQTNIMVLSFFVLALINYFKKNHFPTINQGRFKFSVTIYITITFVIFWSSLFKKNINNTDFHDSVALLSFINTFLLHLFTPLAMVGYYLLTSGFVKWAVKPSALKTLPMAISYLFIYLAYVLIKGTFVGQVVNQEVEYSYPYFFLNIKADVGTFFIYFSIILVLFLVLFLIYYYYNNYQYKYKQRKLKIHEKETKLPSMTK